MPTYCGLYTTIALFLQSLMDFEAQLERHSSESRQAAWKIRPLSFGDILHPARGSRPGARVRDYRARNALILSAPCVICATPLRWPFGPCKVPLSTDVPAPAIFWIVSSMIGS